MSKNNRILVFLMALILAAMLFGVILLGGDLESLYLIYALSLGDGSEELIRSWEDEAGNQIVFLPSYADLSSMYLSQCSNTDIYINDVKLEQGSSCDAIQANVQYCLAYKKWGRQYSCSIVFIQSSNLPTLFLDTESGNMDYIHKKKGNKESGEFRLYTNDGKLECENGVTEVQGRGNATWTDYEKKPYTVKLEKELDLFGMGESQNWVLLANAADYSHMRNKIVYDFAAEIGLPYSPDSRWVDLYLNGEYRGLYLLCEKNEVHPHRVNIGDGFLVSKEFTDRLIDQNIPHIVTENKQALRIHNPDPASETVLSDLFNIWQTVENAILAEDDQDPISGKHLEDLIDVDSWVLNYLIDEVFGNLDGFRASRYFYYDVNDGLIHAGPVWDYDKALGNDSDSLWMITNPNVLVQNRYALNSSKEHIWAHELYEKQWFRDRLKAYFEKDMLPEIETLLQKKICDYTSEIAQAAWMDANRWGRNPSTDFTDAVSQLLGYLTEHTVFLKRIWLENIEYYHVSFVTKISTDHFFAVLPNEYIDEIPTVLGIEGVDFLGWYYSDSDEPFDISKPITEDIEIYAKWEEKPSKKLNQVLKLAPLGVIALIGVGLLWVEVKRWKKSR